MKNNWIRFLAGMIASAVLVGAFALTGGMKSGKRTDGLMYQASGLHPDGELMSINGQVVSCEEYLYWLAQDCEYLASQVEDLDWNAAVTEGMTFAEYAKADAAEAVKQHTGIDFMAINGDEEAVAAARAIGVELPETADPTWGNALYETFDQKVEEKLVQPTFITMHPVDVSPLAKRSPQDPRLTERFELFICRSEMGNAFSELNDPIDQKQRFQKQVELRAKGDSEAGMMDEDYINALEYGLPPTGGLGIGIDRCVMLLTNSDTIREVILFPTMKPLD